MTPEHTPMHADELRERIEELTRQAFGAVDAGDFSAADDALSEAERLAVESRVTELIIETKINRGFVRGESGDTEAALAFYDDGVELARASDDAKRLPIALANRSVLLRDLERYDEAIRSFTDYIVAVEGDAAAVAAALYERGWCQYQAGSVGPAITDFETAADRAISEQIPDLIVSAKYAIGAAYEQSEDFAAAVIVYREAANVAEESGLQVEQRDALMGLAKVLHRIKDLASADVALDQAEMLDRLLGDKAALADALFLHGVVLSEAGRSEGAVEKWREEAELRREFGDEVALADCLAAQASELRAARSYDEARALYESAEEIYSRVAPGSLALANAYYWHARLLRRSGEFDSALKLLDTALLIATDNGYAEMIPRAGGTRAMVLADSGDTAAAMEALNELVEYSTERQLESPRVWAMARKAYVLACEEKPADEVIQLLQTAYEESNVSQIELTGRAAVSKMRKEIKARFAETYAEELDAFYVALEAALPENFRPPVSG